MVTLTLNGETTSFDDVDPTTPLLWALRDHRGLTGTKFGCGMGQCGACTVHLDGRATRSCVVTLADVDGATVTTIEGLSERGDHPVQAAWLEHGVAQCGYCQVGQIMAAASLLAENREPSDDDVDRAMTANICRCGTYTRIRAAIHTAARAMR